MSEAGPEEHPPIIGGASIPVQLCIWATLPLCLSRRTTPVSPWEGTTYCCQASKCPRKPGASPTKMTNHTDGDR